MWENIGSKLQKLAKIMCWLGIIVGVITGIILIAQGNQGIWMGILYLILIPLFSWIGSWATYGLGLVVEYVERGGSRN